MDHATDKVHEQPEEEATDVEGFLGGPHEASILMDYVHHMAMVVWN